MKLIDRDQWIGWSHTQRAERLGLVVQNRRILVEWKALYCFIHKTKALPAHAPTLHQTVRWIAQLGGFLGRKGDGNPGPITLWRGLHRLQDIAAAYLVFNPAICG